MRGTYAGKDTRLIGETALLRVKGDKFLAQFDNTRLLEAFGWHEFDTDDFLVTDQDILIPILTLGDFDAPPYSMFSGSAEAESRKYNLYVGSGGRRWLVADQENAADNIYVEGEPGSDGFGGRELKFELVNGTILMLKGPWHSNSTALFEHTGVDVRDKHLTFGVIGLAYKGHMGIKDVVYKDEKPTIGTFDRIDLLVKKMAAELGIKLAVYSESKGGSHRGYT